MYTVDTYDVIVIGGGHAGCEAALAAARMGVVALVSDAGTPLISDPGYKLVRAAHESGVMVTTAPGACAAMAALTLSGLPSDRFVFEGFLPAKAMARRRVMEDLAAFPATGCSLEPALTLRYAFIPRCHRLPFFF